MGDHTRPADDRQALHQRLAAEIEDAIARRQFLPGQRLPSEHELAQRFGVSRGTVRQALQTLRQQGLVEPVPGRGSFVRHASPAQKESRRKAIGVVVPSVAKPYLAETLAGIEEELHDADYSLLVANSGSRREQQEGRVRRILDERVSGLIVYPLDYDPDPELFQELIREPFPIVFIDRYIPGLELDSVTADNVGGAFQAVSHLIDLGHRRIGFISTDNLTTTTILERYQGYQQALLNARLEPDPSLVLSSLTVSTSLPLVRGDGDEARASAEDSVAKISAYLNRTGRPTALFALHDALAVYVAEAASSLGLSIPDDVAIVGFDDGPLAASHIVPFTSVAQPFVDIGRKAARLVLERVAGTRTETVRLVLPTRLVVRRSSGAPAQHRAEEARQ